MAAAWRHWWAGTAAAVLLMAPLAAPPQAQAASPQLCRQLEADLAAAKQGKRRSAEARRFDQAIEEQERQLALTEADWQRAGCGYMPGNSEDSLCRAIEDTLTRMERNYDQLQQGRADLEAPRNSQAERRRIQREIEQAGCRAPTPAPREAAVPKPAGPAAPQSRLRTVCVRTCDGYFFPMSFGVTRAEFGRDAKACQATCPGTEMRLYYHKVPDQEAADMVSADKDEPYASLPTADLYRSQSVSQPGGCGCTPASTQDAVAGTPAQPPEAPAQISPLSPPATSPSILVLPDQSAPKAVEPKTASTPPAQQPEDTEAAAKKEVEAEPKAPVPPVRPAEPAPARAMSEADKRVRVVGPTFLPGQEEAIDLRAPGRTANP